MIFLEIGNWKLEFFNNLKNLNYVRFFRQKV